MKKPGIIQLADRVLKFSSRRVLIYRCALVNLLAGRTAGVGWWAERPARRVRSTSRPVLGYPCALGMATPLALIRGGGKAANRGILMRSGDAFQIFPDIDHHRAGQDRHHHCR